MNARKDAFPVAKRSAAADGASDPYARVLELLAKEKHRPLKRKGLDGKVKSYLPKASEERRVELLERLFEEGKVAEVEGKLEYAV